MNVSLPVMKHSALMDVTPAEPLAREGDRPDLRGKCTLTVAAPCTPACTPASSPAAPLNAPAASSPQRAPSAPSSAMCQSSAACLLDGTVCIAPCGGPLLFTFNDIAPSTSSPSSVGSSSESAAACSATGLTASAVTAAATTVHATATATAAVAPAAAAAPAAVDLQGDLGYISSAVAAAKLGLTEQLLCAIKACSAVVNARDLDGRTCLHYAAGYGPEDCVDILLLYGADSCARDHAGDAPLHFAAVHGYPMCAYSIAKACPAACLLRNLRGQSAGDVAVACERGEVLNAMLLACSGDAGKEAVSAMKQLLEQGAVPDTWAPNGSSALMLAAAANGTEALQVLLAHGATVELQDALGRSALMFAAGNCAREALLALLDGGACIALRDRRGRSVLDYAPNKSAVRAALDGRLEELELVAAQHRKDLLDSLAADATDKSTSSACKGGSKKSKLSKKQRGCGSISSGKPRMPSVAVAVAVASAAPARARGAPRGTPPLSNSASILPNAAAATCAGGGPPALAPAGVVEFITATDAAAPVTAMVTAAAAAQPGVITSDAGGQAVLDPTCGAGAAQAPALLVCGSPDLCTAPSNDCSGALTAQLEAPPAFSVEQEQDWHVVSSSRAAPRRALAPLSRLVCPKAAPLPASTPDSGAVEGSAVAGGRRTAKQAAASSDHAQGRPLGALDRPQAAHPTALPAHTHLRSSKAAAAAAAAAAVANASSCPPLRAPAWGLPRPAADADVVTGQLLLPLDTPPLSGPGSAVDAHGRGHSSSSSTAPAAARHNTRLMSWDSVGSAGSGEGAAALLDPSWQRSSSDLRDGGDATRSPSPTAICSAEPAPLPSAAGSSSSATLSSTSLASRSRLKAAPAAAPARAVPGATFLPPASTWAATSRTGGAATQPAALSACAATCSAPHMDAFTAGEAAAAAACSKSSQGLAVHSADNALLSEPVLGVVPAGASLPPKGAPLLVLPTSRQPQSAADSAAALLTAHNSQLVQEAGQLRQRLRSAERMHQVELGAVMQDAAQHEMEAVEGALARERLRIVSHLLAVGVSPHQILCAIKCDTMSAAATFVTLSGLAPACAARCVTTGPHHRHPHVTASAAPVPGRIPSNGPTPRPASAWHSARAAPLPPPPPPPPRPHASSTAAGAPSMLGHAFGEARAPLASPAAADEECGCEPALPTCGDISIVLDMEGDGEWHLAPPRPPLHLRAVAAPLCAPRRSSLSAAVAAALSQHAAGSAGGASSCPAGGMAAAFAASASSTTTSLATHGLANMSTLLGSTHVSVELSALCPSVLVASATGQVLSASVSCSSGSSSSSSSSSSGSRAQHGSIATSQLLHLPRSLSPTPASRKAGAGRTSAQRRGGAAGREHSSRVHGSGNLSLAVPASEPIGIVTLRAQASVSCDGSSHCAFTTRTSNSAACSPPLLPPSLPHTRQRGVCGRYGSIGPSPPACDGEGLHGAGCLSSLLLGGVGARFSIFEDLGLRSEFVNNCSAFIALPPATDTYPSDEMAPWR